MNNKRISRKRNYETHVWWHPCRQFWGQRTFGFCMIRDKMFPRSPKFKWPLISLARLNPPPNYSHNSARNACSIFAWRQLDIRDNNLHHYECYTIIQLPADLSTNRGEREKSSAFLRYFVQAYNDNKCVSVFDGTELSKGSYDSYWNNIQFIGFWAELKIKISSCTSFSSPINGLLIAV